MALPMSAVIRRRFKQSKCFFPYTGGILPLEFDARGEQVVGWYRNPPPLEREYIVLTTTALHYRQDRGWVRLSWDAISKQDWTSETKRSVTIRLWDDTGHEHQLRLNGRFGAGGRFLDSFSLRQVIHAVISAKLRAQGRAAEGGEA
ncbi:MAG: hypothetical protein ACYDCL_23100 [Myxococcales bacterium]